MIECKRDRESIAAYVDGELEASARAELESHLESCAACRELVAAQRRLGEMFAALPEVTPPGDFEARFWARMARERDAAPAGFAARLREVFSPRRGLALGAAAAAALGRPGREDREKRAGLRALAGPRRGHDRGRRRARGMG